MGRTWDKQFYKTMIPIAEREFLDYLTGEAILAQVAREFEGCGQKTFIGWRSKTSEHSWGQFGECGAIIF